MQQSAGFYYCRLSLHVSVIKRPSSGVQNTDTAATGTGSYGCRWIITPPYGGVMMGA